MYGWVSLELPATVFRKALVPHSMHGSLVWVLLAHKQLDDYSTSPVIKTFDCKLTYTKITEANTNSENGWEPAWQ